MLSESSLSISQWLPSDSYGSPLQLAALASGLALLTLGAALYRRRRAAAEAATGGPPAHLAEQYRRQMIEALAEGVHLSRDDQALVIDAGGVALEPMHFGAVTATDEPVDVVEAPKLALLTNTAPNRPRPSADELMQGIRQKTRDYVPTVVASGYIVEEVAEHSARDAYAVSR